MQPFVFDVNLIALRVVEKMLGWELGYRASFTDRFFVDIASFYNQYNDLLSVKNRPIVPETDPSPTHFVLPIYLRNGLEGTTSGFEIAPIVQLTDHWRVKSSYSYLSLNVNRKSWSDDASSVQQTEGASPKHSVVVQSMYDLPRNFQLDLTYRGWQDLPLKGNDLGGPSFPRLSERAGLPPACTVPSFTYQITNLPNCEFSSPFVRFHPPNLLL